MNPQADLATQTSASLFNGYVGATAIFALSEVGFFQLFEQEPVVHLSGAAQALNIQQPLLEALCATIVALQLMVHDDMGGCTLTPSGRHMLEHLGYFTWMLGGYSDLLHHLHDIAFNRKQFGLDVNRNGRYVAQGASLVSERGVLPIVYQLLDPIPFKVIADLGCGSAKLLINVCRRYPNVRGIGVDYDEAVCRLARQTVAEAGLSERIEIIHADVIALSTRPETCSALPIYSADVVSSFFMLHDLMGNQDKAQEVLLGMKRHFRQTTHFLFGDTMKTSASDMLEPRIFNLGFELVHAFMRQRLWEKHDYDSLFERVAFNVDQCIELNIPSSWVYTLRPASL